MCVVGDARLAPQVGALAPNPHRQGPRPTGDAPEVSSPVWASAWQSARLLEIDRANRPDPRKVGA